MKAVTAVLLAALVVVLSVIAYDLHRVARVLVSTDAVPPIASSSTARAADDHEQRVQTYMRMLCDLKDCDHAFAEAKKRTQRSSR